MRIKMRYTNSFTDRHGRERFYLRVPGRPAVALPGLPGSAAFMEAYAAGMASQPATGARDAPGSVSAIVAAYLGSRAFAGLAKASQDTYRADLRSLCVEHGNKLLVDLEPRHARGQLAGLSPSVATARLRALRIICRHAIDAGILDKDPSAGIKPPKRANADGFTAWSEKSIGAFEAKHAAGTMARLAFALALYTGQRRADLIRMSRADIRDGAIHVVQSKTGAALAIPIHAELAAILDATKVAGLTTLLTGPSGKPFTAAAFNSWFARRVAEAGLTGLSVHGLRKSCARRLAEAGCSTSQIAAVTGHASLVEVAHYSKSADQAKLARDAMARIG
jgi:integrase